MYHVIINDLMINQFCFWNILTEVVSHQFEDMTQTFRHKAQKFAEQLVTEVFAAREGSVPAEPAGEPPSIPEELKKQSVSPDSTAAPLPAADDETDGQEPQAYRDESRVSEFGMLLSFVQV